MEAKQVRPKKPIQHSRRQGQMPKASVGWPRDMQKIATRRVRPLLFDELRHQRKVIVCTALPVALCLSFSKDSVGKLAIDR